MKRFSLLDMVLIAMWFLIGVHCIEAQDGRNPEEERFAQAVATFNEAQELHEQGLLIEAIALYKKAIQLAGTLPEAEYQLGTALLQIDDKPEAENAFRRALESRPDWSLPVPPLARLIAVRGQSEEALGLLGRLLEKDPENIEALRSKLDIELSTSNFHSAFETIERLSKLSPNDSTVKLMRIRTLIGLGRNKEAKDLLAMIPVEELSTNRTARALAIELADDRAGIMELLKTFPDDEQILLKACTSRSVIESDVIIAACSKLISESKDRAMAARGARAATLLRLGRAADALIDFERILQVEPSSKSAVSGRSLALFNLERWEDARLSFEDLVAMTEEFPIAYFYLGIINDKLARPEDALSNYERFLSVADKASMKDEIERTQLRLSSLRRQVRPRRN